MDNGMLLIGNQISILLAAAAASVAISTTAADKHRKLLGVSLAFWALASGLALCITQLKEISPILTGVLGIYLIVASLPALFNLTGKVTVKAFLWLSLISGAVFLVTLSAMPDLMQEIFSSVYFVVTCALAAIIAMAVCYKRSYFKGQTLMLLPLAAMLARFIGADSALGSAAEYGVALLAIIIISSLVNDNRQNFESMNEELSRLQNQFEDEVEKGVRTRTFHIERIKDRMAEVNRVDHLTKALNRKAIMNELDDLTRSKGIQKFVMLLFDIDKFKTVNDTLGHAVGDECLKTLSNIAMSNIRDVDFLGRYGGDEFIILLPNQGLKEGLIIADRFRTRVSETDSPHFTISVGAAAYPWDGKNFKDLLSSADKGLYVAKEKGRNRVSYAGYIKLDTEEMSDYMPDQP